MESAKDHRSQRWRGKLAIWTAGFLFFESLTGLSIWLLPFGIPNQIFVLIHTLIGVLFLVPAVFYAVRHWLSYRRALMTHLKWTGYAGVASLAVCGVSGLVLTYQAALTPRITYFWDTVHIVSTLAFLAFTAPHIVLIVLRDRKAPATPELELIRSAQRFYGWGALFATAALSGTAALAIFAYQPVQLSNQFPADYSYRYGEERPFAPSQARTMSGMAMDSRLLSGSRSCGTALCHTDIVQEWEVSAHRYSAMDVGFQKIQLTMAQQNGPESTRYCGGCHDPISLFSGTKNLFTDSDKLTSLAGYREGVSCLACHSIRETDLKGNAHYAVAHPERYMFELEYDQSPNDTVRFLRDFLLRAYPRHHVETLSKRLFKDPGYCAACHKQFIDEEINNVGWVQLQNQYDNWRKSRWNHPDNPQRTIECRECHMPLTDSSDPAAGDPLDYNRTADDGKHRSHRFVAANQLMPKLLDLPGWEQQVKLTEKWLRGEYEIPEIADKWASGPAVAIQLQGPESVQAGEKVQLKTLVTSNKVGHDFPTGPLDIIQAWVELVVRDEQGREIYSSGTVDEKGFIQPGSFIFKAEPVDQYGNLIDRHNLWEMVGVRHRRALFPGFSDIAEFQFYCPDLHFAAQAENLSFEPEQQHALEAPRSAGSKLHAVARLKYRKIDQYLLNFIFGEDAGLTSPITEMATAELTIPVVKSDDQTE